ncbi:MAG: SDR family oxidoreductase [Candidatus Daviesbacteria bacterium]|nr:SDR family oxidoreductase [Candidatus Daviesbacteria bacterium]
MQLQGKTFILTGARRIGKDVAVALSAKGANLVISYYTHPEEVGLPNSISVKADLSKEEDIKNLVKEAVKKFGKVDGLVHMAATYPRTPVGEITMKDFEDASKAIAGSALILGQEAGLEMQKNEGDVKGKIVFFSDWSVLSSPYTGYAAYNSAKAGINSITQTLAKAFAPGITVNAIAPGPILKFADLTEEENKEVLKNTPLKRWGGTEEIAKAVLYLLDADFVTGVILPVDGGRSIS